MAAAINIRPQPLLESPSPMVRVYTPMTGWRLAPWLLLYLSMALLEAAVILAIIHFQGCL